MLWSREIVKKTQKKCLFEIKLQKSKKEMRWIGVQYDLVMLGHTDLHNGKSHFHDIRQFAFREQ